MTRPAPLSIAPVLIPLFLTLGCASLTETRPAPRPPANITVSASGDEAPPVAGERRVLVDVADGPADVSEVVGENQSTSSGSASVAGRHVFVSQRSTDLATRPLCRTPCAVDSARSGLNIVVRPVDPMPNDRGAAREYRTYLRFDSPRARTRITLGREETGNLLGFLGDVFFWSGLISAAPGALFFLPSVREETGSRLSDISAAAFFGTGGAMALAGLLMRLAHQPTVTQPGAEATYPIRPAPRADSWQAAVAGF